MFKLPTLILLKDRRNQSDYSVRCRFLIFLHSHFSLCQLLHYQIAIIRRNVQGEERNVPDNVPGNLFSYYAGTALLTFYYF